MTDTKKKICPLCDGKKVVPGTCECDSEWRGTLVDDEWNDCQCVPEMECPGCHGTGYVEEEAGCGG